MKHKSDAIIVLGRVDPFGHPTIDAHERIRYAAKLFAKGIAASITVHAKWSYKLQYTPPITEAFMMKSRLMEWGVPEKAILLEEQSCDTVGAAYFLKINFVLPLQWKRITVVTSKDHLKRTKYIFNKVFGNELDITYEYGRQVLSEDEFNFYVNHEEKSLKLMEETWFGPIAPGDHIAIGEVLKQHPGYNPKAKLSVQDIERKLNSQSI